MALARRKVSASQKVEYREITALEATNMELTLADTPTNPNNVKVDALCGPAQELGFDFEVLGNIISWNGKALETVLEEGHKLRIEYFI